MNNNFTPKIWPECTPRTRYPQSSRRVKSVHATGLRESGFFAARGWPFFRHSRAPLLVTYANSNDSPFKEGGGGKIARGGCLCSTITVPFPLGFSGLGVEITKRGDWWLTLSGKSLRVISLERDHRGFPTRIRSSYLLDSLWLDVLIATMAWIRRASVSNEISFFFSSIFPDILNLSLPLLAMQYTYDDRSEHRAFNLLTIISTRYHSLRSFPREKDYPVFPFFTQPEKEEGGQNTIIQRPLSILFPPFSNLHS